MTTTPSRSKDSMALGDSWTVASVSSEEQDRVEPVTPSPSPRRHPDQDQYAESIDAVMVSSTVSGPELIMPSICETPETTQVQASHTLKQRRQARKTKPENTNASVDSEDKDKDESKNGSSESETKERDMLAMPWEKPLRIVVNLLLMAALMHLLVLPEVVYQSHQRLCTIPIVPTLYPTSCTRNQVHHTPGIRPHPSDPYDSVLALQTQLERLFNSTLDEIAPYADTLPATESILQDLQEALDKAQSHGPTHELTLEFDGCREALTTASRKLQSLQTDLQSAVDSLMATGKLPVSADSSKNRGGSSKDARLSMQMARREKYLDQLAARMRVRADSLTGDFATLANHLESLKVIVKTRVESGPQRADDSTLYRNLRMFVDSLVPRLR